MSLASITRAASDSQFIDRVTAAAHQAVMNDPDKADTVLGQNLINGSGVSTTLVLMYPVAVDTEAAYETALLNLRGAPGFDRDIITDAAIVASVNSNWPMTRPPKTPNVPNLPTVTPA